MTSCACASERPQREGTRRTEPSPHNINNLPPVWLACLALARGAPRWDGRTPAHKTPQAHDRWQSSMHTLSAGAAMGGPHRIVHMGRWGKACVTSGSSLPHSRRMSHARPARVSERGTWQQSGDGSPSDQVIIGPRGYPSGHLLHSSAPQKKPGKPPKPLSRIEMPQPRWPIIAIFRFEGFVAR